MARITMAPPCDHLGDAAEARGWSVGDARLGYFQADRCGIVGGAVGRTSRHHVPSTAMEVLPAYHGVA